MKAMRQAVLGVLLVAGLALGGGAVVRAAGSGVNRDVLKTISISISSQATVVTPSSGKTLVVKSCSIASSVSGVVVFKDNTSGAVIWNKFLFGNRPLVISAEEFGEGLRLSAADHVLTATLSGATLTGTFRCDEE